MKTLQEWLTETALHMDLDIVRSYSGRGMYGRECVGISGNESECAQLIAETIKAAHQFVFNALFMGGQTGADLRRQEALHNEFNQLIDTIMSTSRDNMGLGVVIYWSDEVWVEPELPETESEEE